MLKTAITQSVLVNNIGIDTYIITYALFLLGVCTGAGLCVGTETGSDADTDAGCNDCIGV
jgi:hypothetical protein